MNYELEIYKLHPSVLEIKKQEVEKVLTILEKQNFVLTKPIDVAEINHEIVVANGHEACYLFWINDLKTIAVRWVDATDEIVDGYFRCCAQSIHLIRDLNNHLVD